MSNGTTDWSLYCCFVVNIWGFLTKCVFICRQKRFLVTSLSSIWLLMMSWSWTAGIRSATIKHLSTHRKLLFFKMYWPKTHLVILILRSLFGSETKPMKLRNQELQKLVQKKNKHFRANETRNDLGLKRLFDFLSSPRIRGFWPGRPSWRPHHHLQAGPGATVIHGLVSSLGPPHVGQSSSLEQKPSTY